MLQILVTSATEFAQYSEYGFHERSLVEIDQKSPSFYKVSESNIRAFSLVIPAYNEEKRIRPFLEHLKAELPEGWEVIVVCDGTDNTANIVRSIDNRFKVMEFENRLGKGGAIKAGINSASGNVIGYVDADGAISFGEISKVFNFVDESTQVSVGSRWVRGSKLVKSQPFLRVILGRIYHYMSFALLGIRVKDTQCGIKAFEAGTLRNVMNSVTLKNLSFDTAIIFHCVRKGAKIAEVPIVWNDVEGSKVNPFKTAFIMFLSLLGIRLANSKKRRKFSALVESVRDIIENA